MAFTPRTNDSGISSSNYWIGDKSGGYNPINDNNPLTHPELIGNCTWYSLGRSYEIAGKDVSDELPSLGNAGDWFTNGNCSWERDGYADPSAHSGASINVQLGDILCYSVESGYEETYFGHVEIVEAINSNGTVLVSYSDYGRLYFGTDTQSVYVNAPCHLTSHERLQGVIHNPYAGSTPSEVTLSYSVSPSGYGYITGTAQGTYDYGKSVTITAHANSGHTFTGWSDGTTSATKSFTLTTNKNLIAYFDVEPPTTTYTLSYSVSPEGSGYITGDEQGEYEEGTQITITAVPNTGWIFDHWQGRSIDYDNPKTETMNRDRNYIAYFVEDPTFIICKMKIDKKKGEIHEITILV